jgi:tetratricopeptide (TPR) repeat protein
LPDHSPTADLRLRTYSLAGATACRTAVALAGGPHKLQFRLGQLLEKLQNWPAAAAAYEAALASDDGDANWHFRLSQVRSMMDDRPGAIAALEAALARDDSRGAWHFSLGALRGQSRDWHGAAAAYEAAIARNDSEASWHAQLGHTRSRLLDWPAAAAAYEAALARNDRVHDWHHQLGIVRTKMQDWNGAADSFAAASRLQPANDINLSRLSTCLMRQGKEADAHNVVMPLVARSDEGLEQFLSQEARRAKAKLSTEVVLSRGTRTLLARKITVGSGGREKSYFESLKNDDQRSRRVAHFYDSLEAAYKAGYPSVVPKVHHKSFYDGYGYFLYDYRAEEIKVGSALFDGPDPQLRDRLVDGLVELSGRLRTVVEAEIESELMIALRNFNLQRYLSSEAESIQRDDDYRKLLQQALKRSEAHSAALRKAPQTIAHGDLQPMNIVASAEDGISVLDWESYGWAVAGFDVVSLCRSNMDSPQVEALVDRYFDASFPQMDREERGRITAILALFFSHLYKTPERVPERWLRYLT